MIYSPCSIDPGSTFTVPCHIGTAIVVCCGKEHIDYYYLYLTRLNCFTLSHYGSYSCLSTLKPHLTTLAPRLANGFWLGITMLGFRQLYIKHRTGAPIHLYYNKHFKNFLFLFTILRWFIIIIIYKFHNFSSFHS